MLASESFWSTLLLRGSGAGSIVTVSPRRLSDEFPFLGFFLALFALGNMVHYLLVASYLAVTRAVSGCCMWSTELDSSGDFSVTRAHSWLDSGYMFCICLGAFGRVMHIFYGEVGSNPEVFSLRSHAERRGVLIRCFSSQSLHASSHLKT